MLVCDMKAFEMVEVCDDLETSGCFVLSDVIVPGSSHQVSLDDAVDIVPYGHHGGFLPLHIYLCLQTPKRCQER